MSKATEDPFPHLGRRQLFADISKGIDAVEAAPTRVERARAARAVLAVVEKAVEPPPKDPPAAVEKGRAGRPKKTEPRPWEVEGISKVTWYRRQKKASNADA